MGVYRNQTRMTRCVRVRGRNHLPDELNEGSVGSTRFIQTETTCLEYLILLTVITCLEQG